MQQAISGSIPRSRSHNPIAAVQARRVDFEDLLHTTFNAFARYPVQILVCSFLCFAGASILGSLLYSTLTLSGLVSSGSYFTLASNVYYLQMQVQAAIGAFTFLLGRGAVTWIGLHAQPQAESKAGRTSDANMAVPITLRAAFRSALSRWKPLLTSSLLYGLLISVSLVGITWMLREARLDVSNYRWIRRDLNSIMNMSVVRSISLLPPDPGSPFTELYSSTRYNLSRQSTGYFGWNAYQAGLRTLPAVFVLTGVLGLVVAFTTDTLLCMRNAHIIHSRDGQAFRWLSAVLRLSLRNFWRVAAWRWTVRLMVMGLYAVCLILPIVLHQSLVVPALVNEVRSYWPYPVNTTSYGIGTALVGMVLIAFGLIFEARMYLALTQNTSAKDGDMNAPDASSKRL